jgi:hypothetical protein
MDKVFLCLGIVAMFFWGGDIEQPNERTVYIQNTGTKDVYRVDVRVTDRDATLAMTGEDGDQNLDSCKAKVANVNNWRCETYGYGYYMVNGKIHLTHNPKLWESISYIEYLIYPLLTN